MSKVQELLNQRANEEKKETTSAKESAIIPDKVHVVDHQANLIKCRKLVKELMYGYDSDDVMYDMCKVFSKMLKTEINKNYR
jgi:hypothetical protein